MSASAAVTAVTTIGAIAGWAGVISSVASLAGETKVAKIAGLVSLGTAAYGLASGAMAGAGADAASSGGAAGQTATETVLDSARGNSAISGNAASVAGGVEPLADAAATSASQVVDQAAASGSSNIAAPTAVADAGAQTVADAVGPATTAGQSTVAAGAPMSLPAGADASGGLLAATQNAPNLMANLGTGSAGIQLGTTSGGNSLLDKLTSVGQWMEKNKELTRVAGGALDSAYGNNAQYIALKKRELELQEAERQRRIRNANNITQLTAPAMRFNPNRG